MSQIFILKTTKQYFQNGTIDILTEAKHLQYIVAMEITFKKVNNMF